MKTVEGTINTTSIRYIEGTEIVKTVNNIKPDANGNIEIETGNVGDVGDVVDDTDYSTDTTWSSQHIREIMPKKYREETEAIAFKVEDEKDIHITVPNKTWLSNNNVIRITSTGQLASEILLNNDFGLNIYVYVEGDSAFYTKYYVSKENLSKMIIFPITEPNDLMYLAIYQGEDEEIYAGFDKIIDYASISSAETVKSIDNITPDTNGNISLTHVVKKVNEVSPDEDGNVDINVDMPSIEGISDMKVENCTLISCAGITNGNSITFKINNPFESMKAYYMTEDQCDWQSESDSIVLAAATINFEYNGNIVKTFSSSLVEVDDTVTWDGSDTYTLRYTYLYEADGILKISKNKTKYIVVDENGSSIIKNYGEKITKDGSVLLEHVPGYLYEDSEGGYIDFLLSCANNNNALTTRVFKWGVSTYPYAGIGQEITLKENTKYKYSACVKIISGTITHSGFVITDSTAANQAISVELPITDGKVSYEFTTGSDLTNYKKCYVYNGKTNQTTSRQILLYNAMIKEI